MNIPSNYTLEEILNYYPTAIPDELVGRVTELIDTNKELHRQANTFDRVEEKLREQLYFRDEFIRSTVLRCETATKCRELVQSILLELDESYIEL